MTDAADEQKSLVDLARMAEQMERYEDMVNNMVEYAKLGRGLSSEERNLLSVAFKNVVGSKRSSWRVISNMEHRDTEMHNMASSYLQKISSEIEKICNDVVELIDNHLLASSQEDEESKTFYMKMKGDYFRYAAEVTSTTERKKYAKLANGAYSEAYEISRNTMKPPHPIRLGLALNYSVFFYEIEDQRSKACDIAKQAFDEAIKDMDSVKMSSFKDSSLIMQLLRDNLTLWTSNSDEEEDLQAEESEADEKTPATKAEDTAAAETPAAAPAQEPAAAPEAKEAAPAEPAAEKEEKKEDGE